MKQRLLLALLMLFSSVGFMKVQGASEPIKITVPKDETVKLTIASKSFTFLETNYPQLNDGAIKPSGFNSKELEWTLKQRLIPNMH